MAILAMGADIVGCACFLHDGKFTRTEISGDLSILENYEKYKKAAVAFPKPDIIACDTHPQFISSKLAEEIAKKHSAKLVKIQHHKAHLAAAAYEHKLTEYSGIAADGLGYGDDQNLWGGEVFSFNNNKFNRIGHLQEQPQIGGDSAALEPRKMLFGILAGFMSNNELKNHFSDEEMLYQKMLDRNFNIHMTTSAGRILDAASAFLGICDKMTYPGQPAIELEKAATEPYELKPKINNGILNTTHLFQYLAENIKKDRGRLAATAQMYIAQGLLEIAKTQNHKILFTGGVAHNRMISSYMKKNNVLVSKEPGDSSICIGQALLAKI